MYEDAQEIFNYLPIRRNQPENDYIEHLWQSYVVLDESEVVARPFSVMPFHLLVMLVIQYKVFRIYKEQKEKYELALTTNNPRDDEKDILAPESPLVIAFLGESEIIDFLKIVGLSVEEARNIKKSIIRYRNNKIAHAKGYIEQDVEGKIEEYLGHLSKIQGIYRSINTNIAIQWLTEIKEDDDLDEFLETHFLDSCFSPYDFGDILGTLLEAKHLNFDQWSQIVNKGLDFAFGQTISALKNLSKDNLGDKKMLRVIEIFKENV